MGLWDKIAGTGSKQSSTTNSKQTTTGTQAQTGSVGGTSKVSTLDPGTVSLLQNVIQGLGANVGNTGDADAIRDLSGQLTGIFDPSMIEANIESGSNLAIQNYNNTTGADLNVLSQVIGSAGNSFAALTKGQGAANLSVQLADLANKTRLQGGQLQSQNLVSAIGGYGAASQAQGAPLQQLLAAIATLTGAETTGEQTQVYDLLNSMNSTVDFSGTEVTKGKSTPGLVPTVVSLFG